LSDPIWHGDAGDSTGSRSGDLHGHRCRPSHRSDLSCRFRPGRHGRAAVWPDLCHCQLLYGIPDWHQGLRGRRHRWHRQRQRGHGRRSVPRRPREHGRRIYQHLVPGHLRFPGPHRRPARPSARALRPAPSRSGMSAQVEPVRVEKPRLQRLWESGPAGWNAALTKPSVMIPFFAAAATAPFITQYFVDNFGWTGGEFWVRILATCAMYATLALSLNLVVGYAGLLNLGFIAFFGIGSYAYALVESQQLHQHFPFWLALLTVIGVAVAFSLIIGIP